jgi:serine/threonine protein kinase
MVSNHNNVVKLYADRETDTDFEFYLEHCDMENYLAEKILERTNPVGNPEKLLSYSRDILQGLNYIHQKGIIHADIKIENLVAQSARDSEFFTLKIIDFGLSMKVDGNIRTN